VGAVLGAAVDPVEYGRFGKNVQAFVPKKVGLDFGFAGWSHHACQEVGKAPDLTKHGLVGQDAQQNKNIFHVK